tara:strand:- start:1286 stop:1552 length:267 start_codon:yes stop_codon:yes gene_type:complete
MKTTAFYNKETDKAIQLSFDWGFKYYDNLWLPKSQLKLEMDNAGNCIVEIPMWLLKKQIPSHVYDNISTANVIANFITKNDGDVYCNA